MSQIVMRIRFGASTRPYVDVAGQTWLLINIAKEDPPSLTQVMKFKVPTIPDCSRKGAKANSNAAFLFHRGPTNFNCSLPTQGR